MKKTHHLTDMEMAIQLATEVEKLGGTAYFVGGYVRDLLAGNDTKDLDIEVHGLTPAQLGHILDTLGSKLSIGESFGVYGLKGYNIDIAMPRKETARGKGHCGHKDFDIIVDPNCGTYQAALRRDFTINAMMKNILTGEIIDHFHGQNDLANGIIRHVNPSSFIEDPLRVLRGAQFAARFDFTIAPETIALCKTMDLSQLPKERIMGELKKALLKAPAPSTFFKSLRQMDQLSVWFPELKALIGVPQPPAHHAEGDAWTHTMMVLDQAVHLRQYSSNPLGFMFTAITHDFGKSICTKEIKGTIHAYKHETLGLPLIDTFMHRLTSEKDLIRYVLNLSEHHMKPGVVAGAGSSVKSTNKMFDASVDPKGLLAISIADGLGKLPQVPASTHQAFFEERLAIYTDYMSRPYVQGRDLINAGLTPGENFTEYLALAHKLRLAGIDTNSALKQVLALARKKK